MLNLSRGSGLAEIQPEVQIEEIDNTAKDVDLNDSSDSSSGSPVKKRLATSSQCLFTATQGEDTDHEPNMNALSLNTFENFDSTPRLQFAKKTVSRRRLFGDTQKATQDATQEATLSLAILSE